MAVAAPSRSTLPDAPGPARLRRARALRRLGLGALALFVLAGLTGLLGTRTATAVAEGGGYRVEVTHPSVSRPGHAVRVEVRVTRPGGFDQDEPLRVRLASGYFDLFDENAVSPSPDVETADGEHSLYEFTPPPGEVFVLSVDTRVEPARQRGTSGEAAVLDDDGEPVVAVAFRTRILP